MANSAHTFPMGGSDSGSGLDPADLYDKVGYDVRDFGAVGDNSTNDTQAFQDAIDAAAAAGRPVIAKGTFRLNGSITLKGATNFGECTINYWGSDSYSAAVNVGNSSSAFLRQIVILPKVVCATKPAAGSGWDSGTMGIRIINASECYFQVTVIHNFETNLVLTGDDLGCVYNTFQMGSLLIGKINLLLTGTGTGWVNNNLFLNGRFSGNPAEGVAVDGAHQIQFDYAAPSISPNNNTFVNCSLEGTMHQWTLDIAGGGYNIWLNNRFEGAPTVRWGANSYYNEIIGGYTASSIAETVTGTGPQQRNMISAAGRWDRIGSTAGPMMKMDNTNSNGQPVIAAFGASTLKDGTTSQTTGWRSAMSANGFHVKTAAQAEAPLALLASDGSIAFGDGTVAPAKKIRSSGTSLGLDGTGMISLQTNTYDLGTAANRFRYVRAGTGVQTGAFTTAGRPAASTAGAGVHIFDTTLNKPTWSDGTNWRDATGTIV